MANPVLSPEASAGAPVARTRPTGVAILAVLDFIGAGFLVLAGLMWFAAGSIVTGLLGAEDAGFFAAMGGIIGLFTLAFAIVPAVLGYGLWTGKAWAWYIQIIFTGLGALTNLLGAAFLEPFSIFWLLVNGAILWYLFQPQVRRWFGQNA